jgi:hypothetical protein
MLPAPWITPHVIAEGRKLAGASLVHLNDGPDSVPPDVQPATPALIPAQRRPDVPADVPPPDNSARPLAVSSPTRRAGRHRVTDAAGDGQPIPATGTGGRHRATTPGPTALPAPGDG